MTANWSIRGRCAWLPPPPDWRETLAKRLGQRPRRISVWTELALAGALDCLDDTKLPALPGNTLLSLASVNGPLSTLFATLESARDELPMPIGFLQSQIGQVFPALTDPLGWHGNGRCLTTRQPVDALHLACIEAEISGSALMLGWVDEGDAAQAGATVRWLYAEAAAGGASTAQPAEFDALFRTETRTFHFDAAARLCIPAQDA